LLSFIHCNLTFVLFLEFLCNFSFQVGAGRTRPNTKPKVHTGIDLLFADVPENLRVSGISTSSSDSPQWNKRSSTYFEVLFALQMPISMMIVSSSLHTQRILRSLERFTTGHTRRNFMLPKTGLE
jgi:hypothetical protein